MYQRIYINESCPLDDYPGHTLRILANPTPHEKNEWAFTGLGTPLCPECAKLGPPRGKTKAGETSARRYCTACQDSRARFGAIACVILDGSACPGLDVSSADAALASLDAAQTGMPDELLAWIYMAPSYVWDKRAEELKKRLASSSPNGSAS